MISPLSPNGVRVARIARALDWWVGGALAPRPNGWGGSRVSNLFALGSLGRHRESERPPERFPTNFQQVPNAAAVGSLNQVVSHARYVRNRLAGPTAPPRDPRGPKRSEHLCLHAPRDPATMENPLEFTSSR